MIVEGTFTVAVIEGRKVSFLLDDSFAHNMGHACEMTIEVPCDLASALEHLVGLPVRLQIELPDTVN